MGVHHDLCTSSGELKTNVMVNKWLTYLALINEIWKFMCQVNTLTVIVWEIFIRVFHKFRCIKVRSIIISWNKQKIMEIMATHNKPIINGPTDNDLWKYQEIARFSPNFGTYVTFHWNQIYFWENWALSHSFS